MSNISLFVGFGIGCVFTMFVTLLAMAIVSIGMPEKSESKN